MRLLKLVILMFVIGSLLIPAAAFCQADAYTGTWRLHASSANGAATTIELQVGVPERSILYPAELTLSAGNFKAVYELLLVKKNLRQLGISRNKHAHSEEPFSLGTYTIALNGTFDYSKDLKGEPVLTVNRLPAKKYEVDMPDFSKLAEPDKTTAIKLAAFLKDSAIEFRKINDAAWNGPTPDSTLNSSAPQPYFGLTDTIHLQTRDGVIHFTGNKKSGDDICSVIFNGKTFIDQAVFSSKREPEDILLDTGLNIIALFADNFSKSLPNHGKIDLEFGKRKISFDFTNPADVAATFIVAKLYVDKDKDADTHFQTSNLPAFTGKALEQNERLIGSIVSNTQQIKLAIWDDAVEDGDSVSLKINGKWIVQGFPVKKSPQFLTVTLDPGPNTITFVADNLGSIPPNTSILEIIDGKKKKSFNIETTPEQNNLINIFYEYKPE